MGREGSGLREVPSRRAPQLVIALCVSAAMLGCRASVPPSPAPPETQPWRPARPTIEERLAQYGPGARARLAPHFAAAGVPYPPARFLLLGLKHERELQVYAAGARQKLRFVHSFPVLGASGDLGPKLREGDRQVPEGVYEIVYLNPNSISHLSLALSYPNAFDRAHAEEEGRAAEELGGDIMIHGGAGSIGCLAVGDQAAEDLFVLAADSNWQEALVVVSPVDFRQASLPAEYRPPAGWVNRLYSWLRGELESLPPPVSRTTVGTADERR